MAIKFTQTRSVKSNLYPNGVKGKTREVCVTDEIVREGVTLAALEAHYGTAVCINDICNKRDEALANEQRIVALAALGVVQRTAAHYKSQAVAELTAEIVTEYATKPGGVNAWLERRAAELAAADGE